MKILQSKIARIQKAMSEQGFDVLFCRLSVNVVWLTGYWTGHHGAAAILPATGRMVLLVAETEAEEAAADLDRAMVDVKTYPHEITMWQGMAGNMSVVLPGILQRMGVAAGVIGIEQSFEDGADARMVGDFVYPSELTWEMLRSTFPHASLKDATNLISRQRWVKTPEEVAAVRESIRIANLGYTAAQKAVRPGMTEAELGAIIEAEIHTQGTGRNGARFSRGFASIYAGPRSAIQFAHYACSSGRIIQDGETVIMELGSATDGYWCDLTRHACAGKPSPKAQKVYNAVLDAERAAVEVARPGIALGDIYSASHAALVAAGYGDRSPWPLIGHGVGFNYHEAPPIYGGSQEPIQEGMLLAIEPSVYLPGEFGIREEDVILITHDGAEVISDHPHTFEAL